MKNLRRVLTICMVVAMLASMLVLASCGLFKSKVEKMYDKLADAKSYTYEYVNAEGDKDVTMVDFKNLVVYEASYDKDGKVEEEEYYWYDEDADKYYYASVDGNTVSKYEVEKDEFFEGAMDYVVSSNNAYISKALEWEVYTEEKGVITYERESGEGDYKSTYKTTMKVEDGVLISESSTTFGGTTTTRTNKYYDINKTEIEIPQNVLDAKAEKLED